MNTSFRQGHLSMVVQLMKYGADPSLIDGEGCSCVHLAAQFGHTSIVAYLIAKGQVDTLYWLWNKVTAWYSASKCLYRSVYESYSWCFRFGLQGAVHTHDLWCQFNVTVLMFSLSGCGYDGSEWNDPFDVGSVSDTQVCVCYPWICTLSL